VDKKIEKKAHKGKKALLLGAGGALGGLEAGALIALDEMGVKFDVISGACIGSVLTLAYTSPAKGRTGRESLEYWCSEVGLSDEIYQYLPTDYKVFQKQGGIFDPFFDKWLPVMMQYGWDFGQTSKSNAQRLYNDLLMLGLTMMSPSIVPFSTSISRIAPGLTNLIDFEKIKKVKQDIYINALDIDAKKIELFDKNQITIEHVIAGSSLYFLCPQTQINGKWYGEGSYIDTLNFKGIINAHKDIDTIVVMNILNRKDLVRRPENIYDAYNLSIMLPFVTVAEDDIKIFEAKYKGNRNLLKVKFEIPRERIPKLMDWSVSNVLKLRDIGYEAGMKLFKDSKHLLV
jgi:predicted acylesterase/phospholipase RssA